MPVAVVLNDVLLGSNKVQRVAGDTTPDCVEALNNPPINDTVEKGDSVNTGDAISVPTSDTNLVLGVGAPGIKQLWFQLPPAP